MKIKNQRGFTTLEILIVLLVVVAAGATGYFVWHEDHNSNKPTPSAFAGYGHQMQHSNMPQKSVAIKEWGVKLPYRSSDTLSYKIAAGTPNTATIISANLAAKYSGCKTFGAGQILRYTANEGTSMTGSGQTASAAAKAHPYAWAHIGSYYYTFAHDDTKCATTTAGDIAQNAANSFTERLVSRLQAE